MSKKILMIAYYFPPQKGAVGIERTLNFATHLQNKGWQPIILSIHPRVYENVDYNELKRVPRGIIVKRTFALDAQKDLSVMGRYHNWTALPDRWVTWSISAVPAGLKLIRKYNPDVIWSTHPVPTAHLIALALCSISKIPWIADFRDPMVYNCYPRDEAPHRINKWLEGLFVKKCSKAVFTTPGALRMYAERYPEIPKTRWELIINGYYEEDFVEAEYNFGEKRSSFDPVVLLHSGFLYPRERDPAVFFSALAELHKAGLISPLNLKVVFRGCGDVKRYSRYVKEGCLDSIVFIEPPVSHSSAVCEMIKADGLLILQGAYFNHQIPAKIYEYLRAKRPIFAMTGDCGDTACFLRDAGINTIAPLDSKDKIMQGLLDFISRIKSGSAPVATDDVIKKYDRKVTAEQLVKLVNEISR